MARPYPPLTRARGWVLWALLLWSVWLTATVASAQVPVAPGPLKASSEARVARVSASLVIHRGRAPGPEGRRVRRNAAVVLGTAVYELEAPAREGEALVLLDFAGHLQAEPVQLDEVEAAGYVDGPWKPGRLEILGEVEVEVTGEGGIRERRLEALRDADAHTLSVRLPAGATRVTLSYQVDVPRRYWPFGCSGRRCSLSGAVAPLPSAPARGGRFSAPGGRVVRPARWELSARFADLPDWDPTSTPTEAQRAALRGEDLFVFAGSSRRGGPVAYPAVVWGKGWKRTTHTLRGVEITVLSAAIDTGGDYPFESRAKLYPDVDGRMLALAEEAVAVAEAADAPLSPGAPLVLVQGPLRSALAQSHPTAVLVSDQAWQIVPGDRFRKFHDTEVARACLETLAHGWFAGRQPSSDLVWVQGMVGYTLTRIWQYRREHLDEYAQDILRNLTFMPAVDRLLYTGQASFAGAYFRGAEDALPLRNHPLLFANDLPTGRRIDEKLRDLMSEAQLASLYAGLLSRPGADARRLAERAYGHRLHWFFDQWLGPYPSVDYEISEVVSERTPAGYRHRIVVTRVAEAPLVEPVQVMVTERGGERHYLVWNGEEGAEPVAPDPVRGEARELVGHRRAFELETSRPIKFVWIDPRRRLEQAPLIPSRPGGRADNLDPRFNDRSPHKGRFIYTGFGLSVAASEFANATTPAARLNAIAGFAAFEGSLQRDLRRTGTFLVFKDRETLAGFGASINNDFGSKRNAQRRRLRLRLNVSGSWLSKQSLDPEGGARLVETLSIIDFTERFAWWPEKGHNIIGSVAASHTLRPGGDQRHALTFLGGWSQLWPVVRGHTFATNLSLATMLPLRSDPEFRSLLRAGGIAGLSGYTADEIFTRALMLAQLEYRHILLRNLAVNFLHVGWLRSVGGAAFGGVASASSCDGFDGWFGGDSWYGEVGYGVFGQVRLLGVGPQLVRINLAVPLARRATTCLGQQLPGYLAESQGLEPEDARLLLPPFNVNLVFNHPF